MFPEAQVIQSGALVMAAIYVGFIKVCKNKYRFHGGMLGYCIGFKNGRLITWGGQMPTHYRTQRTLFVLPILLLFVLPLLRFTFQAFEASFCVADQKLLDGWLSCLLPTCRVSHGSIPGGQGRCRLSYPLAESRVNTCQP